MAHAPPLPGLVVWWDEPAGGPENMAADELLAAEAAEAGRPLVRFYGWSEPTVSLGGFQRLADARACAAIAGLPLVRRPSGGGAIIHGSDLTYAVAVPRQHPWGREPQVLYDVFHAALVAVLVRHGIAAAQHPGRDRAGGDEHRLLCFDRRARGDVVIAATSGDDGHKILGSAQRRLRGAVLQHGSLLLRTPSQVAAGAAHPGLVELAPRQPAALEPRNLVTEWLDRVAETSAGLEVRPDPFNASRAPAVAAGAARFRTTVWLDRR